LGRRRRRDRGEVHGGGIYVHNIQYILHAHTVYRCRERREVGRRWRREEKEKRKRIYRYIMLRNLNETAAEFRKAVQKLYCLPPFLDVPCT
jgi:hypothetical protein